MNIRLAFAFILMAAIVRLLPHPQNVTPLAAMGLFGAAYFQRKWLAFLLPMAALFVSDLVLNNLIYSHMFEGGFVWMTSGWIYAAFALVIGVGLMAFNQRVTAKRVMAATIASSIVFFLVTNFWSWSSFPMYPKTPGGLLACYIAGLPFLLNSLLGDIFFAVVMFGAYEWLTRKQLAKA